MSEPEYVTEMSMEVLSYKRILLTWRPT